MGCCVVERHTHINETLREEALVSQNLLARPRQQPNSHPPSSTLPKRGNYVVVLGGELSTKDNRVGVVLSQRLQRKAQVVRSSDRPLLRAGGSLANEQWTSTATAAEVSP